MLHEQNWIALAEILGPRSHALKPLLTHFGTPEAIFAADREALLAVVPTMGQGTLSAILRNSAQKEAARISLWCHRNGVRVIPMDAPDYPACLREIDEPPALLYCTGTLPALDRCMSLAVVGPRKPDAYGEQATYKLSFELAAAGVVIVSGMADGIDGIAAAAAISAGGTTVAVLGCGIDVTYPRHHTRLAAEIANSGAIVTEFAPGTKPMGINFPIRNRIVSALAQGVFVPEAGESSGALITARYALVQGKRLFVLPGDVTNPRSVGSNRLLASGATLVLESQDVLDAYRFLHHDRIDEKAFLEAKQHTDLTPSVAGRFGLHLSAQAVRAREERAERRVAKKERREAMRAAAETPVDTSCLSDRQKQIYALLPDAPFSVDALADRGVPVEEAISAMTLLEIYGMVTSRPGGLYQKK